MGLWLKIRDFVLGKEIEMNTEHIKTAKDFLEWQDSLGDPGGWTGKQRDLREKLFKELPRSERYHVQRGGIEKFFVEENRVAERQETYESPSGKYKLVVDSYFTREGSWSYTCGRLYSQDGETPIAEVKRNYGSFPYMWMEGHPDGHDYLICGEDYQGQTFVQLDTGKVRNLIPDDAFAGFGFCWAGYKLINPTTLLVEGCYWAAPYEYRVFDVSNPMEGWPEYEFPEESPWLDPEGDIEWTEGGLLVWQKYNPIHKKSGKSLRELQVEWQEKLSAHSKAKHLGAPEEELARLKAIYEAAYVDDWEDIEDEGREDEWDRKVSHRCVFKPEDGKLVLVEEWKSDEKLELEHRRAEHERKRKEKAQELRGSCPFYKHLLEKLGTMKGRETNSYPSQVMRWDGDENTFYFNISVRPNPYSGKRYDHTATVVWGPQHGPIRLERWVRGQGTEKVEFPRTIAGLEEAWEAGERHLAEEAA